MILPVLFFYLCATLPESSSDEGDPCSLTNGTPGVCTILNNCQPVYQQLAVGIVPDTVCGYAGLVPVICCPTSTPGNPAPTIPQATPAPVGDGRGEIARQKCAEYARYVYTLKVPPILLGNRAPINVSQCAIKSRTLIVGGIKAERMEFPHMAAVGYDIQTAGIGWYCGGTLISETFVLTAAHCTHSQMWGNAVWVRVGDLNLARSDDGAQPIDRRVSERIRHPNYDPPSQYHDIALLRLERRVPFNGWIRPACLHTAPSTGTSKVIATGWGLVDWMDNEGSSDLLRVTLPLVEPTICNTSYTSGTTDSKLRNGIVGDWMICAGEPGRDTCQGDSGGPLVIFSKPEYKCMYDVVGVTSLGRLCGSVIPGVYTRVHHYLPWIEATVWGQG